MASNLHFVVQMPQPMHMPFEYADLQVDRVFADDDFGRVDLRGEVALIFVEIGDAILDENTRLPALVAASAEKLLGLERLNKAYDKIVRDKESGSPENFFHPFRLNSLI